MKNKSPKIFIIMFCTYLLIGCTLNVYNNGANTDSQLNPDGNSEEIDDKDKVFCERITDTSSRVPKKVCWTLREKEMMEKESEEFLNSVKDHAGKMGGAMPDEGGPGAR
ncbi:MAG: hypothetical protein CMD53_00815 [Gammaproteobacteria bacterium]|jgi:hypothetical protein|nr:hypothetical protein [Gammaproteobacteria bacterium]HJL95757.1 hypothetical protein [SAR86 cluster bacterium]|tara:strand:- start:10649 stop:10975 length:327 start_codon:yes stop_codon:yes gene_type:complete